MTSKEIEEKRRERDKKAVEDATLILYRRRCEELKNRSNVNGENPKGYPMYWL